MNDPGLDAPIGDDAKEVEIQQQDDVEGEDPDGVGDEEESYLEPSRWWFASTAIPLIAGTFGPMASAFNICALASRWRVLVGPGESEDDGTQVPDPDWLVAVNAVSLVIALIANLALLFNMARRLSFMVAQPITIIGWFLSSFLLISLLAAAHLSPSFWLPAEQNPTYTQGVYYAIMAAAIYFVISCLMCITVYGAYKGHYPRAFKLTMSQRTLMVQTISYLVYLLAGGAVFARIENWLFLNGVYWANTTLLTIGTGDYAPRTHAGQSLLIPYAIGGILNLGLVIGSIRSLILERGKKKIGVRMVEKKREEIVTQMEKNDGVVRVSLLTRKRNLALGSKPELQRRRAEFEVMRMIQEHAASKRKWFSLLTSLTAWVTLWFVGAVIFWIAEQPQQGMTYFEALYFSYISLLTIGYGTFTVLANSSKAFFVFWSLLAVPTLTILISNMGDTIIKMVKDATLYLSELTVLPGDKSTKERFHKAASKAKPSRLFRGQEAPVEEAPGGASMPEQDRNISSNRNANNAAFERAMDRLGKDFQEEELQATEEAHQRGDRLAEDKHLYHYLLMKEIRQVMKHMNDQPPRKYTYREWAWFLRLLGENEEDRRYHREPPVDPSADEADGITLGCASDQDQTNSKEIVKWSWIGLRSPLMGDMDEPEWVIERLTSKLESMLHEQRSNSGKDMKNASKGEKGTAFKADAAGTKQAIDKVNGANRSDSSDHGV